MKLEMRSNVFWVLKSCHFGKIEFFGEIYGLYIQGTTIGQRWKPAESGGRLNLMPLSVKVDPISHSETPNFLQNIWSYNPESIASDIIKSNRKYIC
jgi:hypothetical protein